MKKKTHNPFPLSFTRINKFRTCKLSYKFAYVDKIPTLQTSPLKKGTAIHKAIELYTKYLIKNKAMSAYNIQDEIMRDLQDAIDNDIKKGKNKSVETVLNEEEYNDVNKMFARFIDSHLFDSHVQKQRKVEITVAFRPDWTPCAWNDKEAFFRGKIDLIHIEGDLCVITDYKSNRYVPPQSSLEDNLQLETYTFLAKLLMPDFDRFFIKLDFVRYGITLSRTVHTVEIASIPERLKNYAKQMTEETEFAPSAGPHCDYCDYRTECPVFKNFKLPVLNGKEITQKEAEKIALDTVIMETLVKDSKKALKTYITVNEKPVKVGNASFDFHPKTKTTVKDIEAITVELIKKGITKKQIYKEVTLSNTGLNKLITSKNKKLLERRKAWIDSGYIEENKTVEFGCK